MNTHSSLNSRQAPDPFKLALTTGQAMHLGRLGGELTVLEGRAWLTRAGDLGDHRVDAGARLRIAVGEDAVIEPWDAGHAISLQWRPRRQGFIGAVLAEPLRALAWALGALAGGVNTLAHRVAASARRAQGCISGGDSVASSGALN